jgi:hypothetical protein
MNAAHRIRAALLALVIVGAGLAACTQGPGASASDGPAASPSPAAATQPPSSAPSSSGGKGDYDY